MAAGGAAGRLGFVARLRIGVRVEMWIATRVDTRVDIRVDVGFCIGMCTGMCVGRAGEYESCSARLPYPMPGTRCQPHTAPLYRHRRRHVYRAGTDVPVHPNDRLGESFPTVPWHVPNVITLSIAMTNMLQ